MIRHLGCAVLLLVLAGCVPGAQVVAPPTFDLIAAESGLVRLEPPGIGSGAATFRIALDVTNPNAVPVEVAGADADFLLADRRVTQVRAPGGLALAANGTSRWTIDVAVPLAEAPYVIEQVARLFGGERVPYRLAGALTLNVFGTAQRTPTLTLARGDLVPPGPLPLPTVQFDPAASRIGIDGLRVFVEAGLTLRNDAWIGYRVEGPSLLVLLDGRPVGSASVPTAGIPAMGETTVVIRADASLVELGAALATQLEAGTRLQVAVDGALTFSVPGIATASLDLGRIAGAVR